MFISIHTKINIKYKIKQKENYTICSPNTLSFFCPHWPISYLQSRGSLEMFPIPVSCTHFLSVVCADSVFLNLTFYIRSASPQANKSPQHIELALVLAGSTIYTNREISPCMSGFLADHLDA